MVVVEPRRNTAALAKDGEVIHLHGAAIGFDPVEEHAVFSEGCRLGINSEDSCIS